MSVLVYGGVMALAGSLAESKFVQKDSLRTSYSGIAPLILIGTGFWMTMHGMAVGQARKKYMELAKKGGEKDVEERYDLPNLYAQGTSQHARAFNCAQRSHQHIFETWTQCVVASAVSVVNFPITTAVLTLLYSVGRMSLTNDYYKAEGDASKRYAHKFVSMNTWYGLIGLYVLGMISSVKMIAGEKMPFW
jgi:MAPEG family